MFCEKFDSRNNHKQILDEFFKTNVVTPKGEKPSKYAKYLHAIAEGHTVYTKCYGGEFNDEYSYPEVTLDKSQFSDKSVSKYYFKEELPEMEFKCNFWYANISMTTDEYFTEKDAKIKGLHILPETGRIRTKEQG